MEAGRRVRGGARQMRLQRAHANGVRSCPARPRKIAPLMKRSMTVASLKRPTKAELQKRHKEASAQRPRAALRVSLQMPMLGTQLQQMRDVVQNFRDHPKIRESCHGYKACDMMWDHSTSSFGRPL